MTGLTPNNSQTIPTHMAIDPEVMEKARREHLGNDPASLTSSEQELTGNLVKAFGEMGDGLDFEKLTCVSGTNAEKAAQIVVWNSQLTGVKQAIKERADLLRLREQITGDLSDEEADLLQAAREDANDALHGRPNSNRRIRVAQSIRQGLQKSGHSPNLRKALDKAGSRGSLSFDLDIDPRDYLQATVSTSDGWAPEVLREDGYLSAITRPPRIADTIPQMTTTEAGIKYMVLRDRWGTIATGAADAAHGVSITTGGAVTFGASAGVSVANGDLIEGRWLVIANKQYTIKKAVGSTVTVTPNPAAAISNAAWELRDDSAALERGEGDEANEATLKWVEVSDDIQEIAVWIPVTVIQMEDVARIEQYIRGELNTMLRQRVDVQSIFGSGANETMFGMIRTRNSVAPTSRTWSKSGSDRNDQMGDLLKAQDDVIYATKEMYMPNLYYLARSIWTEVALKDTSGSGYYLGSPAGSFRPVLWGLPIVPTTLLQSGNEAGSVGAICLDNSVLTLWTRRGITVEMGLIDRYLIKGMRAIVVTARMALECRRPQAVNVIKM